MDFWWLTPAITSVVVTTFYILGKPTRKRIWRLFSSFGHAFLDVWHELSYMLRISKRPSKVPTLADLINERKRLRFLEMAEWDADFKRLLPPQPKNPTWPHDPSCRGNISIEDEVEIRGDYQSAVKRILYCSCTTCGWSGTLSDGDVYQVGPGRLMEIPQVRKRSSYDDFKDKYQPDSREYRQWKDELRTMGYHPTPSMILALQNRAYEEGRYDGPVDGVIGPMTMQAIRNMHYPEIIQPNNPAAVWVQMKEQQ